tara:strand:- start:444 stop:620 length:177 start_codon:yes stop_codon:yes gene_type:complete
MAVLAAVVGKLEAQQVVRPHKQQQMMVTHPLVLVMPVGKVVAVHHIKAVAVAAQEPLV